MKHLRDALYYEDLYNRHTVEECRRTEKYFVSSKTPPYKGKKLSSKKQKILKDMVCKIYLYFQTGSRYEHKETIIQKWMDRDKERDEKLETTSTPKDIYCLSCDSPMELVMKDIDFRFDKPDRVRFLLGCSTCKKKRVIFDTGEEYIIKPPTCSKCKSELKRTHKRKGKKIITLETCLKCDYKNREIFDFTESKEEKVDPDYEKDRKKFCLSKEKGEEYLIHIANQRRFTKMLEEEKEREKNKALYKKVTKLKQLTVVELEKLLNKVLIKEGYIKLDLLRPEFEKYIIVNFTVQDAKSSRQEYDSKNELRKLIQKTLIQTNWRLMSEGITYRLGYLYGRLKAYEYEKDLVRLVKKD